MMSEQTTLTAPDLNHIALQFNTLGTIDKIQPLGSGNINDTFLVTKKEPQECPLVLQKINQHVFTKPELVMQNIAVFSEHTQNKQPSFDRRWELPAIIKTIDNQNYFRSKDHSFWRAISFIPNSESVNTISNSRQAREIGIALGIFHDLISDLSPEKLVDTLEGFHITPDYFQQYQQNLATEKVKDSAEKQFCLNFINDRPELPFVLENAKSAGKLPMRLMHGDPKVNNILFDKTTGRSVSVIDLDTVKPGLIHYDIGDCLRSGCNLMGEETPDWQQVSFNVDLCEYILSGYLQATQGFLTNYDYEYIYPAIRVISFELGLRFFSDYLAGNTYFKVDYPEHNLLRALVQFQLTQSIENQAQAIQKIIDKLL